LQSWGFGNSAIQVMILDKVSIPAGKKPKNIQFLFGSSFFKIIYTVKKKNVYILYNIFFFCQINLNNLFS